MDVETMLSYEWGMMTPEFVIVGAATLLSLLDLFLPAKIKRKHLIWVALSGIVIALICTVWLKDNTVAAILEDTFRLDSFAVAFKLILIIGAGMVLLLALNDDSKDGIRDTGEYYYLFLTALLGAMIMASSGDLITLFVGLELLSISSYILVGLRKRSKLSNEAALKYVINGGISTAITLFGMSYVYGLTGSTNVKKIFEQLSSTTDKQMLYLISLAFFMMFVGLSFKIAAAPFHMWAPDVYQGAPTPVTAFLSIVSKAAGFVIIIRLFISVFGGVPSSTSLEQSFIFQIQDYLIIIAGVTMIIGNTIALRQQNIKRMLAYSSIAHAGYLLVALSTMSFVMVDSIWFYLVAYLLMNIGVFAILQLISDKYGSCDIRKFAGLFKQSPLLAITMAILLLSLAGIPGTAGFIGKLTIFLGALMTDPSHYLLVAIMLATTVISYYYYFGILTQMFFRAAEDNSSIAIPLGSLVVIVIAVTGTIIFGIFPSIALDFLQQFDHFSNFLQ